MGQRPGAVAAQFRRQLQVGHRNGQVHHVHIAATGGGQITIRHAAPGNRPCSQPKGNNGPDRGAFFLAHGGNAHFNFWDTRRIQSRGNIQLFMKAKRHPRSLFAIAQGGVIDDNGFRHWKFPFMSRTPSCGGRAMSMALAFRAQAARRVAPNQIPSSGIWYQPQPPPLQAHFF